MSTEFNGLVALVTGGGSGIGEACAAMLASRGARVAIADRDLDAANRVADGIAGPSTAVAVDVSDPDSCVAMVEATVASFGRLDIAVNSAGVGVGVSVPVAEVPVAEWRRVLSVNLDGIFFSMRAQIPGMLATGGGSIVNVASMLSVVGAVSSSAYVSAKHGVLGLTKSAALDYASHGIRVNAVGPGHIDSPMFARRSDERRAAITQSYPVGRVGTPHEVAELCCFLSGDRAGFATGGFYPLDGAYTAR